MKKAKEKEFKARCFDCKKLVVEQDFAKHCPAHPGTPGRGHTVPFSAIFR